MVRVATKKRSRKRPPLQYCFGGVALLSTAIACSWRLANDGRKLGLSLTESAIVQESGNLPPAAAVRLAGDPLPAVSPAKCTNKGQCHKVAKDRVASVPLLGPCDPPCGPHAKCFLGRCMCHPGYGAPPRCDARLNPSNPVYTGHCPNLEDPSGNTLDIHVDKSGLSNGTGCDVPKIYKDMRTGVTKCAYQCYSHELSGVPQIPLVLWKAAQAGERGFWTERHQQRNRGDRVAEHHEGFDRYKCLPNEPFGDVIEVGAGPWTQSRSMFDLREDLAVKSFTVFEPSAEYYVKKVKLCAYKTGRLESYLHRGKYFSFPVHIVNEQGELLKNHRHKFDTVVSINVIEHVQDAYDYLTNLYEVLKPGGILVFHDRYFRDLNEGDLVLGANPLHPIRVFRPVFDHFLSGFEIISNNCNGTKGFVKRKAKEIGYYAIARKKGSMQ